MELQVTVTLSDRFFALLEDKLPNLGRRVEKAITKEISARTRAESNIAVKVVQSSQTEQPKEEIKVSVPEISMSATPESTGPEPASTPEPKETPAPEEKKITVELARKALSDTRVRLLGENPSKQSPGYKAISSIARQIIMTVSEGRKDKLPALDEKELEKFIDECGTLVLDDKGHPTYPKAPF